MDALLMAFLLLLYLPFLASPFLYRQLPTLSPVVSTLVKDELIRSFHFFAVRSWRYRDLFLALLLQTLSPKSMESQQISTRL